MPTRGIQVPTWGKMPHVESACSQVKVTTFRLHLVVTTCPRRFHNADSIGSGRASLLLDAGRFVRLP